MLGVKHDTVIIFLRLPATSFLAPIIGQVRRAISVQLHLTLSDWLQGKSRKVKAGSPDQPIAAQAAQA